MQQSKPFGFGGDSGSECTRCKSSVQVREPTSAGWQDTWCKGCREKSTKVMGDVVAKVYLESGVAENDKTLAQSCEELRWVVVGASCCSDPGLRGRAKKALEYLRSLARDIDKQFAEDVSAMHDSRMEGRR